MVCIFRYSHGRRWVNVVTLQSAERQLKTTFFSSSNWIIMCFVSQLMFHACEEIRWSRNCNSVHTWCLVSGANSRFFCISHARSSSVLWVEGSIVSSQSWFKFGHCPSCTVSILLYFHKHNSLLLGRHEPSSPASCCTPQLQATEYWLQYVSSLVL